MARPVVVVSQGPDGRTVEILDAPDEILVAEAFLEELDPQLASYGDGILTIHARSGDVSYGLHHHDPFRREWRGTRAG
jgi:hypothetical protein